MFYVEKIEEKFLDNVSTAEAWIKRSAHYNDVFEANAEMRQWDRQERPKTGEWKMIANIVGPVLDVACCLDQDFVRDKKKFYAWLDRNPQWCTYDRRRGRNK